MHLAGIHDHQVPGRRDVTRAAVAKRLDAPLDHADHVTFMRVRREGVGEVARV